MMAIRSGLERPVLVWVSSPRSSKMRTAAGESLSAMRTRGIGASAPVGPARSLTHQGERSARAGLGSEKEAQSGRDFELGDGLGEGPLQPGKQGFQVGAFDG